MGDEVCPRRLEDRIPDRPTYEVDVTCVHSVYHRCRISDVEHQVLDLHHLGEDLPGLGGGDHDIRHDDHYAQILRWLDDHDLERIVGPDDGESPENTRCNVVRVKTSGGASLCLSGTEDDIGRRELLTGHHMGEICSACCGCAG